MTHPPRRNVFVLGSGAAAPLARTVLQAAAAPLSRMLGLDRLDTLYRSIPAGAQGRDFSRAAMRALRVDYRADPAELARIPDRGPVVVAANHPFGGLEGILLLDMLLSVRPDIRIMANHVLSRVPEFAPLFVFVDPFGSPQAPARNVAPLRQALRHVRQGGLLGVFPAGAVAHFTLRERRVAEPAWSPAIVRLARTCGATVVPVHFSGANGPGFQVAGLVHPGLRTMLLAREVLNKADRTVTVRVGSPVPPSCLEGMDAGEAARFLRMRAEVLGGGESPLRLSNAATARAMRRHEALAPAEPPAAMSREIAALPPESLLVQSGQFRVYEARAEAIPGVLDEIGRLREATFRRAGEGSGRSRDLDAYDRTYSHVFLWNAERREVAGAYRLGRTDEILRRQGRGGLYVDSLFKLRPGFPALLGPALELGRSFVRPEYQKSYSPLLLLWRGIGQVVARRPRYRILFGPVSISNDYRPASRQLIAGYFESLAESPRLAGLARPRTPLRGPAWIRRAAGTLAGDLEGLCQLVGDIEGRGRSLPVLLRQYLKLGGEILAFNVDRDFGDALDGLIVVDLARTDPKTLERYLGPQGLKDFQAYHGPGNLRRTA